MISDRLSPEQLQYLRRHFDQLDLDGDGHLTTQEIGLIFRGLNVPINQATLDGLIQQADKDGNGTIEFDEFVALVDSIKSDDSVWAQFLKATNPSRMQRFRENAGRQFGITKDTDHVDIQHYRQHSFFDRKDIKKPPVFDAKTASRLKATLRLGRGERPADIEMSYTEDPLRNPEVRKQLRKRDLQMYNPYFMFFITTVQFIMLVAELVVNKGFEPMNINPMGGPSQLTQIRLGAEYVPCMRPEPWMADATPYVTCAQGYDGDIAFPANNTCTYYNNLEFICGMGGFRGGEPNQWWRFITPVFLHVGIIHFLVDTIAQIWMLLKIERDIGWWRVTLIFFISGIFGMEFSGNMDPTNVSIASSGCVFAILAVLYLDVLQNWPVLERPWRHFILLTVIIVLFLLIGLLPFIDNYAHIGGFIMGTLTGVIFIPTISFGKWDGRRKRIALLVAVPLALVCIIVPFTTFYDGENTSYCQYCSVIDCVPVGSTWCSVHIN